MEPNAPHIATQVNLDKCQIKGQSNSLTLSVPLPLLLPFIAVYP
jgi:hypothetical protein